MRNTPYIAILGFAHHCSEQNSLWARHVTQTIIDHGFGVCIGNYSGTFASVLDEAEKTNGHCLTILEQALKPTQSIYGDIQRTEDANGKHEVLAQTCLGAIAIGGAKGSEHIAQCLWALNKPVVVIEGSNSQLETGQQCHLLLSSHANEALAKLTSFLSI